MIRNFASFIKFGQKEHIEKLADGEIFCKSIDYFSRLDENFLQGDKYEGHAVLKQVYNIKLKHKETVFTSPRGQLFLKHPQDQGHIYCLYGASSDHINFETHEEQKLFVNTNNFEFADTALLIFDPTEFIIRFTSALNEIRLDCNFSPVKYYDEMSYSGQLTPFHKRIRYQHQNEVRFWIPNKTSADLKFNIGSIKDISTIVSKDELDKLTCEPI